MYLRTLTADDSTVYQSLRLAALRESPASFSSSYEEERDRTVAQVAAFLAGASERIVFGAFAETELVGVCGLGASRTSSSDMRGLFAGCTLFQVPEVAALVVGYCRLPLITRAPTQTSSNSL